jgi:diguanylate cyclase (GGDEF)-like protein
MTRRLVAVSPGDTVRTAMDLLRAEQIDVLPVIDEGALVGSVDLLRLFRFFGEMPVSAAVGPPLPAIAADAALGLAAVHMLEAGVRALVVTREGGPIGLLTDRDLADSWGSIPDPMTGLPWQDQMRRWAAAHLMRSREIAVLFLDLNGFGDFNKQHGHVLGDRILRGVAEALRAAVDPEQDYLCRYGGDEFVIATTRPLLQARALAIGLRRSVMEMRVEDADVAVSAAIGIAGGQRAAQRPGSHAPATLDDLINLASRASTQAKNLPDQCHAVQNAAEAAAASRRAPGPSWPEVRTVPEGYQVTQRGTEVSVSVALRRAGESREASVTGPADELRRVTAEATVAALQAFLSDAVALELAEVTLCATGTGGEVVGAAVILAPSPLAASPLAPSPSLPVSPSPRSAEHLFGTAPLLPDPARSVINAVLDATNRRLGYWLGMAAEPATARAVARDG